MWKRNCAFLMYFSPSPPPHKVNYHTISNEVLSNPTFIRKNRRGQGEKEKEKERETERTSEWKNKITRE